jgi:tRNA (cmo5U34)-methyltransferase
MSIGSAFDESTSYYDDWMRTALPAYDDIFATAVSLIPFDTSEAIDVLDLGAGTGLFSLEVLKRFPFARFVLCDVAEKMLGVARERFKDYGDRFTYNRSDYRTLSDVGSYDVVVSSLSIHHLEHAEKRALFRSIYTALRERGVFINVDQVRGPTPSMSEKYWSTWLVYVRNRGADEEQIAASIRRRTEYDKDASLDEQLEWLSDAGFINVDCVYKNWFIGVFTGQKV